MLHSTPVDPLEPPVLSKNLNDSTLTIHFYSPDGDVHAYEIPLERADR